MAEKNASLETNLKFYPKQFQALSTEATEVLYGGSAGSGKLLKLDTPLLTTEGWKTIGTVEVGDYVFGEDGKPTRVVAKSDVSQERTFEMTFDKFAKIVAGGSHDWCTLTSKERDANTRRTPEARAARKAKRPSRGTGARPDLAMRNSIQKHDYLEPISPQVRSTFELYETQKDRRGRANHTIRVGQPLVLPDVVLPIDPYLLGVWLGDGHYNAARFCNNDYEIKTRLESKGILTRAERHPTKDMWDFFIVEAQEFRNALRGMDMWMNKHIPDIYKFASYEQRLELVRGILDTDGHIDRNGSIEISLSDDRLGNDFAEVVRSLGIKCNIRQREAYLYGERKKDRFRMNFSTELPVFTIPRHKKILEETEEKRRAPINKNWYITEVKEIDPVPTQCIQVDNDSHTYLVGEHLIPTHNSFLLRYAAFLYAMCIPGYTVVLFRRKYSDLMQNHVYSSEGFMHILDPFIKAGKCVFNMSDKRIDFFHGDKKTSHIFLRHLQHESDMYNYQGMEIQMCIWDELTQIPERPYRFIRTRVRLGGLDVDYKEVQKNLPWVNEKNIVKILAATNPGGINGQWVKKTFIDPAAPNTVWQTRPVDGGMKRIFIPAFLTDNTVMMENDPHYADRLRGAGGDWARALLEGRWDLDEGAVLGDLWDDAVHVVDPIKVPDNAYIIRSLDWGTFHPSVVLYMMIANGEEIETIHGDIIQPAPGSVIVINEIYNCNDEDDNAGNRKSGVEVGRQIAEFESQVAWRDSVRVGVADNQIFRKGAISETIHDLIVSGYNQYMNQLAADDPSFRWAYDMMYLFDPADQSSGSRIAGLNLVRTYLKGALDGDDRGLYLVNHCRKTVTELPMIPRSETNPEDSDQSGSVRDHAFDVIKMSLLARQQEFQPLRMSGF